MKTAASNVFLKAVAKQCTFESCCKLCSFESWGPFVSPWLCGVETRFYSLPSFITVCAPFCLTDVIIAGEKVRKESMKPWSLPARNVPDPGGEKQKMKRPLGVTCGRC